MPTPDTFREHRRLLCQIEAEIQDGEDTLHRMRTEGADHFRQKGARARAMLSSLGPDAIDRYLEQMNGVAQLDEAAEEGPSRATRGVLKAFKGWAKAERAPEPTEAQRHAGNYTKVHGVVHGLQVAIENPKGTTRSGVAKDGTKWETTMKHHYGYIKRTEGADGDHVDCFIGPDLENPYVHVINQIEPTTGEFDEHKVMLGFRDRQHAIDSYHANYQPGWKGMDTVRTMHIEDFKHWLKHGDTEKNLSFA